MTSAQLALWDRLEAFVFDEPGTQLTFARRLARENGWTEAFAQRVVEQYKRFLFLALEAGHVVCPSEHVDQAWHLHLTYTRSYWEKLCSQTLGKPVHHEPTKGGAAEQDKHIDLYRRTLTSYERLFGEAPPADIWPAADRRFGEDLQQVRVNTAQHWIVPKPRLPERWRSLFSASGRFRRRRMALAGCAALPLVAASWNPLDMRGPEFLALYVIVALLAAAIAIFVRIAFRLNEQPLEAAKIPPLDPYEAAALAGGQQRAVYAALAAMMHEGTLAIVEEKSKSWFASASKTFRSAKPLAHNASPIEQAIYQAAAPGVTQVELLASAAAPAASAIEERLREWGLLQQPGLRPHCVLAGAIMASPALFGVCKIVVGLARHRPVGGLVVLVIATIVAALVIGLWRSRLTAAGRAMLARLTADYGETKSRASVTPEAVGGNDWAMMVGLFGASVIATGPLSPLYQTLPRGADGGGCGSGCGGGGGGCGGGGCGGCGGG